MNGFDRSHVADTVYPATLRVMGPQRDRFDDADVEEVLAETFPEADPGDVESFMRRLQNFGRQISPIAQRVLPGVAQGAVQGGMAGGPWGALAGAVGGGVTSALRGGARPPPSPGAAAAPPATRIPPVGARPGAAAAGGAAGPGAGTPAAAQLLTLLSRPETMQALLALLMSGAGRTTVQVGGNSVPAAAFANSIAELAAQAAESAMPVGAGLSDYLLDDYGNPRTDIADPAARASLLVQDLADLAAAEAADEESYEAAWVDSALPDRAPEADDPLAAYDSVLERGSRHEQ